MSAQSFSIAALALLALLALSSALADTSDPFPSPITTGQAVVAVHPFATLSRSAQIHAVNQLVTNPEGDIFTIEQFGKIYTISANGAWVRPYLDVSDWGVQLAIETPETGAQSIAFHPDFFKNGSAGFGKFYTVQTVWKTASPPDFSSPDSSRVADYAILEWQAADPHAVPFSPADSAVPYREVLRIAAPDFNHTMGLAAFNPNAKSGDEDYGKLYVGVGDGGGEGDPRKVGQNKMVPYGKIDPLGTNSQNGKYGIPSSNPFVGNSVYLPEIWALGLRNPQRFSWDEGGLHQMFIADIGQGTVEEIDLGSPGANYGWSDREGSFVYAGFSAVGAYARDDAATSGYTYPIAEYDHSEGISVTAGFVVRGSDIPVLNGKFLFGDIAKGRIFFIDADHPPSGGQSGITELRLLFDDGIEHSFLSQVNYSRADLRFGRDLNGRIFLLNKHDNKIRVLADVAASPTPVPTPTPAPTPIPASVHTVLSVTSEPGDWIGGGLDYYYTPPKWTFTARSNDSGSYLFVQAGGFTLVFRSPGAVPFQVGKYEDNIGYNGTGSTEEGGMFITGNGTGGSSYVGSYEIKALDRTGMTINSIWLTFTQYTDGSSAALRGELRFNVGGQGPTPTPLPTQPPSPSPSPEQSPTATATPSPTSTPVPSDTPPSTSRPKVSITTPPLHSTANDHIRIRGVCDDQLRKLTCRVGDTYVNVEFSGNTWMVDVPLEFTRNVVVLTAIGKNGKITVIRRVIVRR